MWVTAPFRLREKIKAHNVKGDVFPPGAENFCLNRPVSLRSAVNKVVWLKKQNG